ncbi:MAG: IS66 family insertion sequence element accessory protein TnpB [Nannocystaceae bacterium]|nr:IS66 family insertion sequence element accessory protein TnpB [Nannocystaceae bacterium]
MILLPGSVKVYVATQPVNLRKSFDGLSNEARVMMSKDPLSGHLFVFINRRKNQVKLLMWTRGGYTIVHKRLEKGTFASLRAVDSDARCVQVDVHELSMLLEGLTFTRSASSSRWQPGVSSPRAAVFVQGARHMSVVHGSADVRDGGAVGGATVACGRVPTVGTVFRRADGGAARLRRRVAWRGVSGVHSAAESAATPDGQAAA